MPVERVVSEEFIAQFDTTTTEVFSTVSPSGRRLACTAKQLKRVELGKWGDEWVCLIDGQEQHRAGEITPLGVVFSPDSQRWAYTALTDKKQFMIVVDGQEPRQYEEIVYPGIEFSPDSQR